jgi:hypothetical protein
MPSISPAASMPFKVAPAGAAFRRISGGSATAIFSVRPGSSITPCTQTMSEG